MQNYLIILISAVFVNNFIFSRFLGLCPFIGVSTKLQTAIGMGVAVIFVLTFASALIWVVDTYLLIAFKLEFLRTITFILVIAAFVQFVEMVINKFSPALYRALGIYLPLITTNCAVLGTALINVRAKYNFLQSTVHGFSAGLGFTLALVLMSTIRERLELSKIPKPFQGSPIAFITTALLALVFFVFKGLVKE